MSHNYTKIYTNRQYYDIGEDISIHMFFHVNSIEHKIDIYNQIDVEVCMGLFENIRGKTDSTGARIIFGAVIVVFIFSFVNVGLGGRTATYATVNGTHITGVNLQKKMQLVQAQRQMSALNEDEMGEFRKSVLDELIIEQALLDRAKDLGIEVSDTEIASVILQEPGFKDASGDFSEELYEQAIKSGGYNTKSKFEEKIRKDIMFTKLQNLVLDTVYVSEQEAQAKAEASMSNISIEWIRLSSSSVQIDISDAEIDAEITTAKTQIEAEYNADLTRKYQKPESVNIQRIVLPFTEANKEEIRTQANAVREQALGGTDFTSLVQEHSATKMFDGMLENATKESLGDTIAGLVFVENPEKISAVVETATDFQIISFIQKNPATTIRLDEAQRDIAKNRLMQSKKDQSIKTKAEQIRTEWDSTEGLSPENTTLFTVETAAEISINNPKIPGVGNAPDLILAIQSTTTTGMLPNVYQTTGGYVVAKVTSITRPNPEDLQKRAGFEKIQLERQRQMALWEEFRTETKKSATVVELITQ